MKKNNRKFSQSKNLVKTDEKRAVDGAKGAVEEKQPAQVSFSRLNSPVSGKITYKKEEQHIEIRQGPLPSPEILRCYNDINGKFAEIIVQMAVTEQDKAIEAQRNEFTVTKKAINSVNIGRIIGAILFLSVIALAAYALHLKEEWVAKFLVKAILAVGIISTAGIGIVSWLSRKKTKEK